jgi:hypothetical protein
MDFNRFIAKHIPGLRILRVATSQYIPGSLLDRRTLMKKGDLSDILTDLEIEIEPVSANIVYGEIAGNRISKGKIDLLGLLSLQGRAENQIELQYNIKDIKGKSMTPKQLILHPRLNEIRRKNRFLWRQINNQFVMIESFYADLVTITFKSEGKILSKLELEKIAKLDINPAMDHQWGNRHVLTVTQNANVPFGTRGFTI